MSHTRWTPASLRRGVMAAATAAAVAACDNDNPAEVRTDATTFPVTANWTASANPVGTSTARGSLAVKQRLGFRMDATFTITGAPNTTYQWRIYRGGDCSVNAAATNATSNNGIFRFATDQSYPDVTTNAAGTATVTPVIAGSLDSLTAYSVRVRPGQAATAWNGLTPIACGTLQRGPA
jgi:hypothetical protein